VVEEVCRPCTFRLLNGSVEVLDRRLMRLALGGCDRGEGSLTVYVPPTKAPEVWCVASFEVFA